MKFQLNRLAASLAMAEAGAAALPGAAADLRGLVADGVRGRVATEVEAAHRRRPAQVGQEIGPILT